MSFFIPVIKTFEKELLAEGIDALKPLERADAKEGMADPDEVTQVVVNRTGSILSASTILKSDFFSNLQKMTLPEYRFHRNGFFFFVKFSNSKCCKGESKALRTSAVCR